METLQVENLYSGSCCCTLIRFNELLLLVNCGISDTLDPTPLAPLLRQLGEVDAVLLSHGSVAYCG
ncbi:hypothetical protein ETH_00003340, partial [Eimeria tenella]